MIIMCPNCQTRYQVAEKAIGSAGRKVQCANCQESWSATAEPEPPKPAPKPIPKPKLVETAPVPENPPADDDTLFSEADESALDEAFDREQKMAADPGAAAAPDPKSDPGEPEADNSASSLDPALNLNRIKAMQQRQKNFAKKLPMGKIKGNLRLAGLCILAIIIGGGLHFRTEVVRLFPDLAGVYESVGLGVNIIGLEFGDVQTLRTMKNGEDVLIVTARIQNISNRRINVPAVVVTILDAESTSLYSWSVTPVVRLAGPGEIIDFEAQLNASPTGAETVKLTFADGRAN